METKDLEPDDKVQIEIPAYVLEVFPNGDVMVDADGKEVLVAEDEVTSRL